MANLLSKADYLDISYPFVQWTLNPEDGTLLCGVQSCCAGLDRDNNLNEEISRTL